MLLTGDLVRTRCAAISLTTKSGCLAAQVNGDSASLNLASALTPTVSVRELAKGGNVFVRCM